MTFINSALVTLGTHGVEDMWGATNLGFGTKKLNIYPLAALCEFSYETQVSYIQGVPLLLEYLSAVQRSLNYRDKYWL